MKTARNCYRHFSSMKTGMALLVLLGAVSVLGSAFFSDTFFYSPLFRLLLLLLFLNMACCTINRLRSISRKRRSGSHWPRQLGLVLLHAGVVLILAGGIVYSSLGQTGELDILTGRTAAISQALRTTRPFSLRLNDFQTTYNRDGTPAQYYSRVTIIAAQRTRTATISVNHPLNCNRVKVYQENFGYMVQAAYKNTAGKDTERLFKEGDTFKVPGSKRLVKVYAYFPDFNEVAGMEQQQAVRPDNPRIIFSVYEGRQLLGVGEARFGERIKVDNRIYVTFPGVVPYTVLKVKSDPGLPLTAAGGLLLMAGVSLALLSAPGQKRHIASENR